MVSYEKKQKLLIAFCKMNKPDLKKKIEYLLEIANILCFYMKGGIHIEI